MRNKVLLLFTILFVISSQAARSETEFSKEFMSNYDLLLTDLSKKPPAELAEIEDFTYKKDLATFHFEKGRFYLLREVLGRPTTAIFIGKGTANIEIPVHAERQTLVCSSKDSVVREQFEVAFIRMADDFDLKLKERFTFEKSHLAWRDFNIASKKAQGEFFFRPVLTHLYDNLFQLLRSAYERDEDGYFWVDFNRHVFNYDPNRPEEVSISYEWQGGDDILVDAVLLPKEDKKIVDDTALSYIYYPTTSLSRDAYLRLKGTDGDVLDTGRCDLSIEINKDSLKFVSTFLHYSFNLDSVQYNGSNIAFKRRRTFTFTGIMLPDYVYKGDTVNLRFWYHGKIYGPSLPFVDDLTPSKLRLTFNVPKGHNLVMPSMGESTEVGRGRKQFLVEPEELYQNFVFQPYTAGFDTVQIIANSGVVINYLTTTSLDKRFFECSIPFDQYQPVVTGAIDYLVPRLGMMPSLEEVYIYPESSLTMPGLIEINRILCEKDYTGGLYMLAANQVARQWFGAQAKPRSDREYWILSSVPDYMSLLYVQESLGSDVFFGEVARRRDYIKLILERNEDQPLGAGRRVEAGLRATRGSWIMHMLRYMMHNLETGSDRTFLKFTNKLAKMVNSQQFANADVIRLAEESYGEKLDWFFYQYLYHAGIPRSKTEYSFKEKGGEYYIDFEVTMSDVPSEFQMPVIMRVTFEDGSSKYLRKRIRGFKSNLTIGPFDKKPKEFVFNELYSMLSLDKMKKK